MSLKLKAKTLAAEARLTRAEERKLRDRLRLENCSGEKYIALNGGRRLPPGAAPDRLPGVPGGGATPAQHPARGAP